MDMSTPNAKDAEQQAGRALHNVGEIYAQAAQNAAEYVQAFFDMPARSLEEWQECQRTWIDWLGRTTELTARATRDFVGCRDLQQFADLQRQFVHESRRHFVEAGAHMLDLSGRIAEKAASPIEEPEGEGRANRRRRAAAA